MLVYCLLFVTLIFVLWNLYNAVRGVEGFEIPNYKAYEEAENPEILITANTSDFQSLKERFDKLTKKGKGSVSDILDNARTLIQSNTRTINKLQKEIKEANKHSK
tara:strand:- start:689 stop:1003 length:315 start_codon:yes stop_codon:yes gene_type:complete